MIKTGIANVVGNKGAIGICFKYKDYSLLILNCHLAAGQSKSGRRNADFHRINYELEFNGIPKPSKDSPITDKFDFCIWLGDFNYRINLPKDTVFSYLSKNRLDLLLDNDQMTLEISRNTLDINDFYESKINFLPTYKFVVSSDDYNLSDKPPGWTDRILYKTKKETELQFLVMNYNWIRDIRTSDHKPVIGEFIINMTEEKFPKTNIKLTHTKENKESGVCIAF